MLTVVPLIYNLFEQKGSVICVFYYVFLSHDDAVYDWFDYWITTGLRVRCLLGVACKLSFIVFCQSTTHLGF